MKRILSMALVLIVLLSAAGCNLPTKEAQVELLPTQAPVEVAQPATAVPTEVPTAAPRRRQQNRKLYMFLFLHRGTARSRPSTTRYHRILPLKNAHTAAMNIPTAAGSALSWQTGWSICPSLTLCKRI